MIFRLLDAAADATTTGGGTPQYMGYIALAVIAVAAIILFVVSGRNGKKRQKEYEEEIKAITRGTKIKTIGGICGVVLEVCPDNTIVIETGSEESGKSFVKIDKTCIAQTDLNLHPEQIKQEEPASSEGEKREEAPSEEAAPAPQAEEKGEDPFEEKENS